MGISHLLALLCGGAVVSICHEAWRRMCAAAEDVEQPIVEPTRIHSFLATPDLLDATIEPLAELQRIETELCKRVGAKPDSDAADVVMHAVRDGHDWDAVLDLEREYLFGGTKRRLARWM